MVDAGYQLEASVSSPHGVSHGFFWTFSQHGENQTSYFYFNNQASEVMHHFLCILFTEAIKVPFRFKRKKNELSLFLENGKILEEHLAWKHCCNHFEN